MRPARRVLALLPVIWAVSATPSAAQEAGVFIDPRSPTGKEYAIPIEQARRDAMQGSATTPPQRAGERSAPLFGEGILPDRPAAAPGTGSAAAEPNTAGAAGAENAGTSGDESAAKAEAGATPAPVDRLPKATAGPSGSTGMLALAGGGLGVMLVGGITGLLLRRRSEPS